MGKCKSSLYQKTILLQKRALRVINHKHFNSHTEPLFKNSSILMLVDLFELHVLLFMYDYANGYLPSSFSGMFQMNHEINSSYITRQSNLYYVPKCKTNFVSNMLFKTAPHTWNSWSPCLNDSGSRKQFKSLLNYLMLS